MSDEHTEEQEPAVVAGGVGARLREAREEAGLELNEVAAKTRIPQRHLLTIENGALTVGRRWRRSPLPGSARIEVTAPNVDAVTLAGSGTLAADGLNGDHTAATLAGSGRLELDRLSAGHFAATIAGSGDLVASGNARNARISIAGSGAIEARGLMLGNASLTIAGPGDARLSANGRVSANIAGGGSAEVMGTTDCQQTRTGSGHLTCSA